jgi:hypothetical protein
MAGRKAAMYVWPSGTSVEYEMTTDQTISVEVPGAGEQMTSSSQMMAFALKASGPRVFEVTIKDVTQSAEMEAPTGMVPEITELSGWTGNVTIDEQGEVVESTNLEGNPYIEFIGVDAFKQQTLQIIFQILPEGTLKTGVEWSKEWIMPMNMMGIEVNFNFTDDYTCLEETDYEGAGAFKIGSVSNGSITGGGEMPGAGMVDFAMSGTAEGTNYIDSGTGMVLGGETMIKMGGGISAQGMDIPMTMQLSITLKMKK